MILLRPALIFFFCIISISLSAQTVRLIGTSEEFILENVRGYASVEERGIEHEEFNVLVFTDRDRELSFYFTFYKGSKICSYIKNAGPLPALKEDIDFIKSNFTSAGQSIWHSADKTVEVKISENDGKGLLLIKELRN